MIGLLTGPDPASDTDDLGDLMALISVRKFPARVKCVALCWHTLADVLAGEPLDPMSTSTTKLWRVGETGQKDDR